MVDAKTRPPLTDHLWFTTGKWSAGVRAGDVIEFDARADEYIKGYHGRRDLPDAAPIEQDWRLTRPTKVIIVSNQASAAPAD